MSRGFAPAVLAGLLFATPALSAQLISDVRDSHGQPWKQREVRLLAPDGSLVAAADTGADGVARFGDVPPGHYIVETSGADGSVTRQDVSVNDTASNSVSLVTDAKPERAAPGARLDSRQTTVTGVTVTAVRATRPGALRGDVVATESVNSIEMRKIGATSLIDSLSHLPGIDIQVECSVCNVRSVTLDNLPGRFTTLTLDGLPIYSPVSNAYGLDMMDVNGLDRIDVSRGAATSLTTPESLAGTINMVTKVPTQDAAEIDVDGGNFGYQREAFYGAKVFDWGALSGDFTHQAHDSVDGVGYGISQFTGYDRYHAGLSLDLDDLGGFKIKTRVDYIWEDRGGGPLGDDYSAILASTTGNPFNWSAGPNASPYRNTWVLPNSGGQPVLPPYDGGQAGIAQIIFTRRIQFVSSADRDFDGTDLHLAVGYAHHSQSSWYGMDSDYWDNQNQLYLDADLKRSFGDATVTVGANYKFEQLTSQSISTTVGTPYYGILRYNVDAYTYSTPGAYLQFYDTFLDKRLELNASIREDDNNVFGALTTPRLDLLWHHTDNLSSRLAVGTGYRLPTSFFEQDHGLLSANTVDRSQAKPERSQNVSYSLNYANDRVAATLSLNHTTITDMALFVNNAENNFVLEPAQHPFTVNDADLSGTWQATPSNAFTLGLEGYLYDFNASDAANAALFSRPEYRVHLGYDHSAGPWDFNVRATFTGPQDLAKWYDYADNPIYNLNGTPKPNWSPTFWVVDMHTSYQVTPKLAVDLGINNLTDYQQAKHDSFLFQDPYGNLNVTYIWGPNIGRSFVLGLRYKFL